MFGQPPYLTHICRLKQIMPHRVSLKAPPFAGATQQTFRLVLALQSQVRTTTCSGAEDWDVTQDKYPQEKLAHSISQSTAHLCPEGIRLPAGVSTPKG